MFEFYWISLQETITLNGVDGRYIKNVRRQLHE